MPECPYCGKWFKTKKGLNVHISKMHALEKNVEELLGVPGLMSGTRKRKKGKGFSLF